MASLVPFPARLPFAAIRVGKYNPNGPWHVTMSPSFAARRASSEVSEHGRPWEPVMSQPACYRLLGSALSTHVEGCFEVRLRLASVQPRRP